MLSVVAHKNLATAESYFSEHLSQNDYYAAGEVRPGEWIGAGTERLTLGQRVEREQFEALCRNRTLESGERWTQRLRAHGERRVFYDFTCSAPKSVSILAGVLGDQGVMAAHEAAARVAFRELERFSAVRVRKQGGSEDRITGNVVAAAFLHTTSRALDPQLHTHFTVFNGSWDPQEQRWKALQAGGMYQAARYATQVYRNDLARRVHELGYRTVRVEDWFEIDGVSPDLIRRFSKRSLERDRVVAEMEQRLGRRLSNNEVSYAVHRSRSPKVVGISSQEVYSRQLAQLSQEELGSLESIRNRSPGRQDKEAEAVALKFAMDHHFERRSVVPEHELLETALSHRHGAVDLERLKRLVRESKDLVPTDKGITTVSVLRQELELLSLVRTGKSSLAPMAFDYPPSDHLYPDQRRAVRHVLQSADRITGVRGLAGSGKTTMLQELAKACKEAGYQVRFCSPTAAATEVLRKEGLEAVTVARALLDKTSALGPTVTILDEAGAVGLRDMTELLQSSERVVLVGDTGQHNAVVQGDALRLIEEHSPFAFAQLNQIRRQRPTDYRKAVERAARQDATGALDLLERMGAVIELAGDKLHSEAVRHYMDSVQAGRRTLMVAPTWNEIDELTRHVRAGLKQQGILGVRDEIVSTFDSLSWTQAQKQDSSRYQRGYRLRFHHPWSGLERQEAVEVLNAGESLVVRRADGSSARVDPAAAAHCFDVGVPRSLNVAPGDKLLLQANAPGLVNGELVEVARVDGPDIELRDGRILPPGYRSFTHGYVVTSHAAQGKTVEDVIVVASSRSHAAVHREQFYVSISRGRDSCRIFTDDRLRLRARLTQSSHRIAAVEALCAAESRRLLMQRALKWARQLPLRLKQWTHAHRAGLRPRQTHSYSTHHRSIGV